MKRFFINIYFFFICFLLIKIFSKKTNFNLGDENEDEIIELKDLENPLPSPDDPNIFYIPIIHTNDIHFIQRKFYFHLRLFIQ